MATNATTQPTRQLRLISFNEVQDDVPTFAFDLTHSGQTIGTCPIGSIALFAGRPGAGKSTTGRHIAARVSTGTLPGCWQGTPHSVVYIAQEESAAYIVKPALRAAGADMSRVLFPQVTLTMEDQGDVQLQLAAERDLRDLAAACIEADVKVIIVDPLMAFINGSTDLYKSNEIRERLRPWATLAELIEGVVIGITHLNKSGNGDVVAGINGSSAFGEVARTVFCFTKDPQADDDTRVMSLEKNSLGREGFAWRYRIRQETITTDKGRTAEMAAFEMVGESAETVGEILRQTANGATAEDTSELREVVLRFLEENGGSAPAAEIEREVRSAGLVFKSAQNQKRRWGITSEKVGNVWHWVAPNAPHDPTTPQQSPHVRDHGTLGSSQVKSKKPGGQGPKVPRSQDPLYKAPAGDWDPSDTQTVVLDCLSTTHPQTAEQIAAQLPRSQRQTLPEDLKALSQNGLASTTPEGRYLRASQ